MAELTNNLFGLIGQLGEMTFYEKNGKTFARPKHIHQPRRLSRSQLAQREKQSHNNKLWSVLKQAKELYFEGGAGPYYRFMAVNQFSPTVYLTKQQLSSNFALLLPETVVSDGPLPPIEYRLGEHDGSPALLTNLPTKEAEMGKLLLYTLHQRIMKYQYEDDAMPWMQIEVEEVNLNETAINENGWVVLKDERFADPMKGFALVRVVDGHVSHQRIVTHCTYYERFTTEEALLAAAKSYKGLTG